MAATLKTFAPGAGAPEMLPRRRTCVRNLLPAVLLLLLWVATPCRAALNSIDAGDILVANYGADSVIRIEPATGVMRTLGVFAFPTDLAMTTNGYLYVAERDGIIQRLNLVNGTLTPVNAGGTLSQLWGIVIGPANELYVTSRTTHGVLRVDPQTGQVTPLTHSEGGVQDWPVGIELADSNHLVVAFYNSDRVISVALDTNAPPLTLASSAEGINLPWGVAVAGGLVYCADQDTRNLQQVPITGGAAANVWTLPGLPYGLSADLQGNLVVSTISPDEIRVVTPQGSLRQSYFGGLLHWATGVEVARGGVVAADQANTPPVLAAISDRTVSEGNLLRFTLSASDTNWPAQQVRFKLNEPFPDGSKLASDGGFEWIPTESQGPASYLFTVRVTDDGQPSLSATQSFTITVAEANTAPSLTPIGVVHTTVGFPVEFTVLATDADLPAQPLTFTLVDGPAGAAMSADGLFTWTPEVSQGASNYLISVVVTDSGSPPLSASAQFTVSVGDANLPPVLGLVTNRLVNEGSLLVYQITAADSNRPPQNLTFTLEPGAPAGAQITAAGVFTWRPGEADGPGQHTIGVKVTDDGLPPLSATNSFDITVQEVNTMPTLAYIGTQWAKQGVMLAFTNIATDSDLPPQGIIFTLDPGAPEGAQISPDGVFTWVPTVAQPPGAYSITIRVSDDGTPVLSAAQNFTVHLTVVPETNTPPVLGPIDPQVVAEGSLLTFAVTATDTNRPAQALTFSLLPGAPAGASLTAEGVFSWTPDEAQGPATNHIAFKVTDNGLPPLSSTGAVVVVVQELNSPPLIVPVADQLVVAGGTLSFQVLAIDLDVPASKLTFTLDTNPPAGAAVTASGLFTWTPPEIYPLGTNLIRVRVEDDGTPPLAATQAVVVVVRGRIVIEPGDILAANFTENCVLRISPQTGAQELLGTFDLPTDLALGSNACLYVSEWGGLIKRLDLTNGALTVLNPGTALSEVWGLALGPDGSLFVTSLAEDRVVRIHPTTGEETVHSQGDWLSGPYGIAVLNSEQLVVSSGFNNRLVAVDLADGAQTVLAEDGGLEFPWGVAVSGSDIYVAGYGRQLIQRVSGGVVYPVCLVEQIWPAGIAVAGNGDLIASGNGAETNQVLRLSAQGELLQSFAGGWIGEITGLEVATAHIGPQPSGPYLEASARAQGPFQDEPNAVWHAETVSTPLLSGNRFFRLRSAQPLRITRIGVSGDQVWLEYRLETP